MDSLPHASDTGKDELCEGAWEEDSSTAALHNFGIVL